MNQKSRLFFKVSQAKLYLPWFWKVDLWCISCYNNSIAVKRKLYLSLIFKYLKNTYKLTYFYFGSALIKIEDFFLFFTSLYHRPVLSAKGKQKTWLLRKLWWNRRDIRMSNLLGKRWGRNAAGAVWGWLLILGASRGGLNWIQATPKINNQRGNKITVDRE